MNSTLNKQLHYLLSASGLVGEKADLVLSFTDGRSESSPDMNDSEAIEMINWLQTKQPEDASNKMRRKIISLAYEMRWAKMGDWKAAVVAIDKFCSSPKGLFKKPLKSHSYNELVQVVTQFKSMYKKYLNKI